MKPRLLVARPTALLGRVYLDAPDVLDRRLCVGVARWATDVLDVEAWSVGWLIGERPHIEWHTTPGKACARAVQRFTVAGNGSHPVHPSMLLRHPLIPTCSTIADRIVPS